MLTAKALKAAKPKEKPYKMHDSGGLFVIIRPNGRKWWRFRYRLAGKTKELSMGTFPEVTIRQARLARDEARQMLAQGIDPASVRAARRFVPGGDGEETFMALAREWHERFKTKWSPATAARIWRMLERDVLPWIGSRPLTTLQPIDVLSTVRRIEERGAIDTAHRVLSICNQVLRYAVQTGRLQSNPARDLAGALPPAQVTHRAAITDPEEFGRLLRAIDDYTGDYTTRVALQLAPLVFVRPGELRHMEWEEIDEARALWEIPAQKMKMKAAHIVPLSRQALALLREIKPFSGPSGYVFPSLRSRERPISNNTLNAALRRMGFSKDQMTAHGFRASARTMLDEQLRFPPEIIEHQLAHTVRDPLGRAYNRTTHLAERAEMMQAWADYLDRLKQV